MMRHVRLLLVALVTLIISADGGQAATGALLLTIPNPETAADDRFGGSVAALGANILAGADGDDPGGVTDAGSAYLFNGTTGANIRTIPNPAPAAGDSFGDAVAAVGGNILVGAPFDDPGGVSNAGSVYLFNGTTGALLLTIPNPAPAADDLFGSSVAALGANILVGAPQDVTGGFAGGAAYLFNGTTGALLLTIPHPAPADLDYFGNSVAALGANILVGAPFAGPGGTFGPGSAYLFDGTTGALLLTIPNPAPADADAFGGSVAALGANILAGANADDPGGVGDAGSAYLFNGTTGALLLTIPNPAPADGDSFGVSVAAVGANILAGADFDDPSNAGSAYLFDGTTGALLLTIPNPAPAAGDLFGNSVAALGANILAGAYADDPGGLADAGSAYTFNGSTGALLLTIPSPDLAVFDIFGTSVAALGGNILVGAPAALGNAGSAYLFNGTTGALLLTIPNPAPAGGDSFGVSVAALGANILVGADGDDPGGVVDAGSAYLFNGTTGALLLTIPNPAPAVFDLFGSSVAALGANILVGAPQDVTGGFAGGAAYLFNGTTGALLLTIPHPAPADLDYFGNSVAALGANILVGAPFAGPGGTFGPGSAYLFDGTTGALLLTIPNPAPADGDAFGGSVAALGANILTGANADDPGGVDDAGSAYLFNGTTGALLLTIPNPAPAAGDAFGDSVAALGANILVGAAGDDPGGVFAAGSAYLFDGTTGALLLTIPNPAPAAGELFGSSVAALGANILAGARADDPGGLADAGSVYLFCYDLDDDGFCNQQDNCPTVANPAQTNTDGDSLGDSCDPDDDNDLVSDIAEPPCGADPLDVTPPLSRPERLDGVFATVDDDGDTMVDEALPGGSENFDCDGDGYRGDGPGVGNISEKRIYTAAGTANDQDPCGNTGWPADLVSAGPSANKITLTDLSSFIAPLPKKLGTDPGDPGYNVRWDLVTGNGAAPPKDIILTDISNLTTLFPPMLGGVKAFSGPVCPWAP